MCEPKYFFKADFENLIKELKRSGSALMTWLVQLKLKVKICYVKDNLGYLSLLYDCVTVC